MLLYFYKISSCIYFPFLIFFCSQDLFAQTHDDITFVKQLINRSPKINESKIFVKSPENEFQLMLGGTFLFYKSFISSQDKASCMFTPSCSEYAITSIKRKGFFIGILETFDRLSRCNGLSRNEYEMDSHTHKCIDFVTKF